MYNSAPRFMRHLTAYLALLAASAAVVGCPYAPTACTRELQVVNSPADTTIRVGEGFTASVQLLSCGGAQTVADGLTFASADTLVAVVDPVTGQVVGRGVGSTRIEVTGTRHGPLIGSIVRVEP